MNILRPIWLFAEGLHYTSCFSLHNPDTANAEPIKETYDRIRNALAFLGEPKVKQKKHNNTLIYSLVEALRTFSLIFAL